MPVGGGGLGSRGGRKGWQKQEVNERMDPMVEEEEKKGGRREDTTRGRQGQILKLSHLSRSSESEACCRRLLGEPTSAPHELGRHQTRALSTGDLATQMFPPQDFSIRLSL